MLFDARRMVFTVRAGARLIDSVCFRHGPGLEAFQRVSTLSAAPQPSSRIFDKSCEIHYDVVVAS